MENFDAYIDLNKLTKLSRRQEKIKFLNTQLESLINSEKIIEKQLLSYNDSNRVKKSNTKIDLLEHYFLELAIKRKIFYLDNFK